MTFSFDIMSKVVADGTQGLALGDTLRDRPFQLFVFDDKLETANYVPTQPLIEAANVSIATGRPLLLTGEPGTGKTAAATWIAGSLGLKMRSFQVRSESLARQLFYDFDAISHFRESQIAAVTNQPAPDKGKFVKPGPLWEAVAHKDTRPMLLLIDEIDKAPRDFPNDLLRELDKMIVECPEKDEIIRSEEPGLRPLVVITSNSERRLPEPFLRRCIYHNIVLDKDDLRRILERRNENLDNYIKAADIRNDAIACFFGLRDRELQKKPSFDEFWQWLVYLSMADPANRKILAEVAKGERELADLPYLHALIKLSEDKPLLRVRLKPA